MILDGEPVPDNPFCQDSDVARAANFVWALGFRNPFGLEVVRDQVFVADNGFGIDRFLRIKEGSNALWDGNDLSIGTNADAVISPGHGVAQLKHYPDDSNFFPDRFQDSFYLGLTGSPGS